MRKWTYSEITTETEKTITGLVADVISAKAMYGPDDYIVTLSRNKAYGVLQLWNALTHGHQVPGDNERMMAAIQSTVE